MSDRFNKLSTERTMSLELENLDFPEYPLEGRYKLAFNWIPNGLTNLLDAGCAWGYGTRFFREKSKNVYGLDPTQEFIKFANQKYPDVSFVASNLEETPFATDFFDAVILCDTLEHVKDEIACLNEIFRILKPGGIVVITTPHKGLFGFMDPGNSIRWMEYFMKKNLSFLYALAYRVKKGNFPQAIDYTKPVYDHDNTHRHYSQADLLEMLDKSLFYENYQLLNTFRSGFFIGVLTMNLNFYMSLFVNSKLKLFLLKPLMFLSEVDYWIPYNFLAYNIGIKIQKK